MPKKIPTMARRAEPLKAPKALPRPERIEAFRRGLSAESRAALLLIAKAYRILVEVKARASADDAMEAVTERTKHRIVSAAELWLARYPGHANDEIRFDV